MNFETIKANINGDGKDIIYVDNKYYMITQSPGQIASSEDLKEWQVLHSFSVDNIYDSIAYGNGIFVVVGDATNGIYISEDGIVFKNKKLTVYSKFGKMNIKAAFNTTRYINNQFVIVTGTSWNDGHSEGHIIVSKNGKDWKDYFESDDTSFMEIAYGNGIYVAVGTNGGIYTSKDLINWTKQKSGVSQKLVGVNFGKNQFIITGVDGVILTSSNGVDWIKRESNTTSYLIRSRYGNGMYVAVGYNAIVLTSIDGVNWQEQNDGYNKGAFYGMTFVNNSYVITGNKFNSGKTCIIKYEITRDINYSDNEDCIYVFDKNLNMLGIIDEFVSLRWRRKYFEAGDFDFVVNADSNNLPLLCKKDNILIRQNYTEAGIIDIFNIVDNGKDVRLTVSGRFLSSVTDRRIIKETINFSGETIDGMKTLINSCAPISNNFEIESTSIVSPHIDFQCTYKNLYEYLIKLSKYSLIGFRIVPNIENKVFMFENYKGLDRTINQSKNERYVFSNDMFNIEKSELIYSSKDECNYILVGGSGEGSSRIKRVIKKGNYSGFDLKEKFVDAKNQTMDGITQQEYYNVLDNLGEQALSDGIYTFKCDTDTSDYKVKWDLGDIINLKKEEWNIVEEKMITEVEEIIENAKKTVSITLGDPLPEELIENNE